MLIPLGVDRPLSRPTRVNHAILFVLAGAYLVQLALLPGPGGGSVHAFDGLVLDPRDPRPWAFVSYAFLHDPSSPFHLLFNALFLWVFGPSVEDRLGRVGYPAFFLLSAAASGGVHSLVSPAPVIGASGAVAGVIGAFLVLFPRTRIRTFCFFVLVGFLSIPAPWFIAIAMIRDFIPLGLNISDGVAHAAHLGGYVFGIAVSAFLLMTRLLEREPMYDLVSVLSHRARRTGFAGAGSVERARARRPGPSDELDPLTLARAAVSEHLARRDLPGAAVAYRALLARRDSHPGPTHLSRRHQYELANHLFQSGDHALAAVAYQTFLDAYPRDTEAADIRLLLATILARYLNEPVRAKALLSQALEELRDPSKIEMARRELADLA